MATRGCGPGRGRGGGRGPGADGVAGGVAGSAAELIWALILACVRRLPAEDALIRTGGWQSTVGMDLEGHTVGVVGLGRLGRRVATVGLAFGMEVLAWSTNLDPGAPGRWA